MALQQEPRALALESVASAFYAGEPDAADLETAVLRDLAWVVAFVDDIGEAAGRLGPALAALVEFLNSIAPDATREWRKHDPWSQPLRHSYLARADHPPARALVSLVAPLFHLGGVLFDYKDKSELVRLAPQVFLEELDWACVEIPDFEESLLPIRVLVMDALEAAGPEPVAEPTNRKPTGEPTMSDDTKKATSTQPEETSELRPERLGQTEKLRPERLGQTDKLRPERLGEPLSAKEVQERTAKLSGGWRVAEDIDRLTLARDFPSVLAAAGFVIQVVEVGSAMGYVPEVRLADQEVEVRVASSVHGKLTEYDFELARQIQPA